MIIHADISLCCLNDVEFLWVVPYHGKPFIGEIMDNKMTEKKCLNDEYHSLLVVDWAYKQGHNGATSKTAREVLCEKCFQKADLGLIERLQKL